MRKPSTDANTPSNDDQPTTEPAGFATPPLPTNANADMALPAVDRYAVVRLHAEGGLGQVFVARDLDFSYVTR